MLARCAGKEKYYPLVEALFLKQKDWVVQKPIEPLLAIAKQAGFTKQSFEECLANQKILEGIEAVRTRASEKLGVNSTPTFFINGKIFRGTLTVQELEKQIDAPPEELSDAFSAVSAVFPRRPRDLAGQAVGKPAFWLAPGPGAIYSPARLREANLSGRSDCPPERMVSGSGVTALS